MLKIEKAKYGFIMKGKDFEVTYDDSYDEPITIRTSEGSISLTMKAYNDLINTNIVKEAR